MEVRRLRLILMCFFAWLGSVSCSESFRSANLGTTKSTLPSNQITATPTPTPAPGLDSSVTFSASVGNLIAKNCAGCHSRSNGIAPFPLENFNDVTAHAQGIRYAVANRTMPPPGVDNSGACQEFTNATWLSSATIEKITSWIDGGMPRGDANFQPTLPGPSGLQNPDKTLTMPAAYTPKPAAGEIDDYRCFVLDPQQASDTMITALQVNPDKAAEVHHVIIFKPASVSAQNDAQTKSGADGRPGYSCFGSAGVSAAAVGLWAPGGSAQELKDPASGLPLGIRLEAGRKLIMQVHYNTQNGAFADQSSISLKFSATAKPVRWVLMGDFTLDLPFGQTSVSDTATLTNSEMLIATQLYEGSVTSFLARDMTVFATALHMHKLGRTISLEKLDNGTPMCMARAPKFDFNWQSAAVFKTPLQIKKTDQFKITCNYSTLGRTTNISFGEGTNDEMCLAFMLVTE